MKGNIETVTDLVVVLFYGVLALQFPVSIFIYFDARRLNLKNPEMYFFGVVIPAVGFVVILYYISERRNLPKKEMEQKNGATE